MAAAARGVRRRPGARPGRSGRLWQAVRGTVIGPALLCTALVGTALVGTALVGTALVGTAQPAAAKSANAADPTTQGKQSGNASTQAGGIGVDPSDTGSLSAVTRIVGAQTAWAQGWTGKGVDVALIDTGVARVTGLAGTGQVIDGPDLSFDAATGGPAGVDAYGHGTLMAGIIAGRDPGVTSSATGCTSCLNSSGFSTTAGYVGVAPESRIVNVKVGAADGAADVTQVIAAIDWVVQHAQDPGLNIRVLNLSYGSESLQPYQVDPLAHAVEQAWARGIVVVVSGGNDGRSAGSLASPAYDPYLLAVGGLDSGTLLASTKDDKVPQFAQHGTTSRPVDVVAPATHLIGLRVPGSYADTLPNNVGRVGDRFQRGSGTSEAAAVVSGVAALLLQRYPSARPDQIKALLSSTATALFKGTPGADELAYSGHGTINAAAALSAALPSVASSRQTFTAATGTGTLDATRNGVYVTSDGVDLTGQRDVFNRPFNSASMAALQAAATSWNKGSWNTSRWSGDGWTASGWATSRWSGDRWSGSSWDTSRWSGSSWDSSRWSGSGWSSSRWTTSRWSTSRWSVNGWD